MTASTPRRLAGRIGPLGLALLVLAILFGTAGGAVGGALITGKQIKNNSVTGKDIKDNSLSGKDIKDEATVWGAIAPGNLDNFTSSEFTPIVAKTLSSRGGYLTIVATVGAQDDESLAGTGYLNARLRVDNKYVASQRWMTYGDDGQGGGAAITIVVPVAAGAHKVELMARETGSGTFIFSRELSILYTASGNVSGTVFSSKVAPRQAVR